MIASATFYHFAEVIIREEGNWKASLTGLIL